jgi:integrase/recombinase XerD
MSDEIKKTIAAEEALSREELLRKKTNTVDPENLIDPLYKKIDLVTDGLNRYLRKQLKEQVSIDNSAIISDYALIQKTEMSLSVNYRSSILSELILFCKSSHNKPFFKITRDDIISYLDSLRKPESIDPLHKWIGSYNLKRECLVKFFKWLYNPDLTSKDRPIPSAMKDIPRLKRREQSIYKPNDLWTREEDFLFLKYCPSKRDKCYHAVSRDASARPHEILGISVRSIHFKLTADNKQYAEVLVNGKTGSRHIPLIDSIPYLKDWIDNHPQPGNPNALLIPSMNHSTFGRKMSPRAIFMIYKRYKTDFFPRLIEDPNIPSEDKQMINELLKKPWNPYIRRHSALTEKSRILKEHTLRQHAGWSPKSQMHLKYLHYFGNESSESLLEAYGIVTTSRQPSDILRPKICPSCDESANKPDAKFCTKCRMVLTYDAYSQTLELEKQKEDRLAVIEERFNTMQSQMQALILNLKKMKGQQQINDFAQGLFDSGIIKLPTK